MSVLINGMEMPTSPVLFCIHPDGKVFADLEGGWREYSAVPVPPHGRLIDADALTNHVAEKYNVKKVGEQKAFEMADFILFDIPNAPTIIPASEEDET